MFRGRSKTRLRLKQFARLYPETSTPFRWLCTGSPKPTPTQKQGKVVRPRCNDLRFSSRLPMPEPGVRRPKQTAQLSERQRVLSGPAGARLAEGTRCPVSGQRASASGTVGVQGDRGERSPWSPSGGETPGWRQKKWKMENYTSRLLLKFRT